MKKIAGFLFFIAALHLGAGTSAAQSLDFSNLQYVVGTGTNETALVISWNEAGITPDSLVWGYKWNMPVSGTAPTMYTMVKAILAADPRLQITANPQFNTPSDYGIYSIFFDLTGQGGSPTVGLPLNQGGSENGYPPYSGDLYREGWYTGFWGVLNGSGNPFDNGSWSTSAAGVSTDTISNNGWYALSFSTDGTYPFTIPNPGFPTPVAAPAGTPVPVPGWATEACFVLLGAVGMIACWRRAPHPS